jgi:signal transduction histidine kinase
MFEKSELVYTVFYVMLFLVLVLVAVVVFVVKSRKKIFDKELEKKDLEIKFQKDILLASILTQEKERERIAQDLHDEISSKLNVVSLTLHSLKSTGKTVEEKTANIDDIIKLNNNAIENSRKIAHNLLPPVLEKFGLSAAIDELVLDFGKTKSVAINYSNNADFSTLHADAQLNIFRIVQELFNNSIKHGKASNIKLAFSSNGNEKICTYSDDGLGFSVEGLQQNKGLGMRNIESRVSFLNGHYQIKSEKNNGIQFTFSFTNE